MFRTRLATTLRLGSLLASLLLSQPGTSAPLPPASSPGSTAAAQDSTGTMWALPEENGSGSTEGTLRDWSTAVQIARWLRALRHGTDSERDAAVAGLVKTPA